MKTAQARELAEKIFTQLSDLNSRLKWALCTEGYEEWVSSAHVVLSITLPGTNHSCEPWGGKYVSLRDVVLPEEFHNTTIPVELATDADGIYKQLETAINEKLAVLPVNLEPRGTASDLAVLLERITNFQRLKDCIFDMDVTFREMPGTIHLIDFLETLLPDTYKELQEKIAEAAAVAAEKLLPAHIT